MYSVHLPFRSFTCTHFTLLHVVDGLDGLAQTHPDVLAGDGANKVLAWLLIREVFFDGLRWAEVLLEDSDGGTITKMEVG